jgi:electron transport complex protein RnfE
MPLTDGLTKSNPTFRLVLGTCPTLAVTTSALNGLTMGLATAFVLICSNAIISLLRNFIPSKVRIPCYVLVIAAFVTVVQMLMNKFLPELYTSLGLFIPLIVVNCIILARAESFASANPVLPSMADGLGSGLGFTLSLTVMGFVRELIGAGAVFGHEIVFLQPVAMSIFIMPAGGFLVYGFMMVIFNVAYEHISKKLEEKKPIKHKEKGGNA